MYLSLYMLCITFAIDIRVTFIRKMFRSAKRTRMSEKRRTGLTRRDNLMTLYYVRTCDTRLFRLDTGSGLRNTGKSARPRRRKWKITAALNARAIMSTNEVPRRRFRMWNSGSSQFSKFSDANGRMGKEAGEGERGTFGKEIPEKITRKPSPFRDERNHRVLPEKLKPADIHGKGIPLRRLLWDEGTRLQRGTRRLARIPERTGNEGKIER